MHSKEGLDLDFQIFRYFLSSWEGNCFFFSQDIDPRLRSIADGYCVYDCMGSLTPLVAKGDVLHTSVTRDSIVTRERELSNSCLLENSSAPFVSWKHYFSSLSFSFSFAISIRNVNYASYKELQFERVLCEIGIQFIFKYFFFFLFFIF